MEGELTRPVRPDHSEVRAQTMTLTAKMEKYAARIEEIKELTANRKGTRAPISEKERALRKELNDSRSNFQSALRQKQSIRDELNKANQGREQLRTKLRQMKENSKFSNVEEIDLQIKKLEEKINKTELTEAEQEDCIDQIRQLVRSREKVRSLRKQLDTIQSDDNPCEDLMDRLKDVDAELDKWKSKEKELQKEMDRVKREREEEEMDVAALISEKQECWQVLCALKEKKKEINDAFTERMNEFKKQEKEYRIQKKEQERRMYTTDRLMNSEGSVVDREEERKAQREKEADEKVLVRPKIKETVKETKKTESQSKEEEEAARKEKERKQSERRQRQIDYQRRQQEEKIEKCNYLMAYLTPLMPSLKQETKEPEAATATTAKGWHPSEAGMKELKKSEPEERDAWLMGNKGKKSKSKKSKKSAKAEKPEDRILMHSLPTLQAFREFDIPVPDTLADVPKTIQALEKLKEHYQTHHEAPRPSKSFIADEQPETPDHEAEKEPSTETVADKDIPAAVSVQTTETEPMTTEIEHPADVEDTHESDGDKDQSGVDVTAAHVGVETSETTASPEVACVEYRLPETLNDEAITTDDVTVDVDHEDDGRPETPPSIDTRLPLLESTEIPSPGLQKLERSDSHVQCRLTTNGAQIDLTLEVTEGAESN